MSDVLVLCYHAVSERWPSELAVSPELLDGQLTELEGRGYRVTTFTRAVTDPPWPKTLAVTFVIGNAKRVATSLFGPGNTIASLVALEFGEAGPGSLKLSSLLALGFILFILTFIVLAISRLLLRPHTGAA